MAGSMNFFVEINAEPVSLANSADLSVYLVEKNKDINFLYSLFIFHFLKNKDMVFYNINYKDSKNKNQIQIF